MSTNKSTAESLCLVPAAAKEWFGLLSITQQSDILNRPSKFKTYEKHVEVAWIREVVRPWFHEWALDADKAEYEKWPTFLYHYRDGMDAMEGGTDTELAIFYLKEHTVKEESGTKDPVRPVLNRFYALPEEEQAAIRVMYTHDKQGLSFERFLVSLEEGDLVPEIPQDRNCPYCMVGITFDDPKTGTLCEYHKKLYGEEKAPEKWLEEYAGHKSEMEVTEDFIKANEYPRTKWTGAMEKEYWANEGSQHVPPESLFEKMAEITKPSVLNQTDKQILEYAIEYGKKHFKFEGASFAFVDGANWQKEQDRALIQTLLDAMKVQMTSLRTYGPHPLIESQYQSAITKADQFLGTKS